ncbi:OsmC family protein [bacterium]|nr:OsmC family protein [bacterium]MBU1652824.1 OsmC family protein [bacterium]
MKTIIKYNHGNHFSGETASGHLMHWDSGPKDSVTNGPTPMEGMLQAGAVCSAMDVVSILKKRRKEITRFDLEIEAERAEDHPKIFTTYRIIYRVGGNSITREEVEKAVKLSQDKYCSIINMLIPEVAVDYEIEIV